MRHLSVGMGELQLSSDPESVLVSHGLGSCIAVMVYDAGLHLGGMLHVMLPVSTINTERAASQPATFADTGLQMLFDQMARHGAAPHRLRVKLAGGANVCDASGTFDIGRRNHEAVIRGLARHGLIPRAQDVGGSTSRTAYLYVQSGRAAVRTPVSEREL